MRSIMRKIMGVALLAASVPAGAQDWPAKQVNFIVPFSAGGNLGAAAVARAAPDGYTFLVGTVSMHAINPFLYSRPAYDTVQDFQPVSLNARLPNILGEGLGRQGGLARQQDSPQPRA